MLLKYSMAINFDLPIRYSIVPFNIIMAFTSLSNLLPILFSSFHKYLTVIPDLELNLKI